MNRNWFLKLISLYAFFVVEEGETQAVVNDEPSAEPEAEQVSVGDAAWDALQEGANEEVIIGEDGQGEVGEEEAPVEKQEEAEVKEEPQAEKPEEKELTDDDLKPLGEKNQRTNERFQKVTEGYKRKEQEVKELQARLEMQQESFNSLRELGFNNKEAAEDLVTFSVYRQVLANGDADQFKQIISEQIKQFELKHGKRVAISATALDAYPDLKSKVESLELDEADAIAVASARKVQERANRDATAQRQEIQTEEQKATLISSAVNEVVQMEQSWRQNDPDFNVIMPQLKESIEDIKKLHPTQWAGLISMQYKAIKKAMAAVPKPTSAMPLRGNGHMAGKPSPTSMAEATLQAMGFAE